MVCGSINVFHKALWYSGKIRRQGVCGLFAGSRQFASRFSFRKNAQTDWRYGNHAARRLTINSDHCSFGTAPYSIESGENIDLLIKKAEDALHLARVRGETVCAIHVRSTFATKATFKLPDWAGNIPSRRPSRQRQRAPQSQCWDRNKTFRQEMVGLFANASVVVQREWYF